MGGGRRSLCNDGHTYTGTGGPASLQLHVADEDILVIELEVQIDHYNEILCELSRSLQSWGEEKSKQIDVSSACLSEKPPAVLVLDLACGKSVRERGVFHLHESAWETCGEIFDWVAKSVPLGGGVRILDVQPRLQGLRKRRGVLEIYNGRISARKWCSRPSHRYTSAARERERHGFQTPSCLRSHTLPPARCRGSSSVETWPCLRTITGGGTVSRMKCMATPCQFSRSVLSARTQNSGLDFLAS